MMARKATQFKSGHQFNTGAPSGDDKPAQRDPNTELRPNYTRLSRQEFNRTVTSPVKEGKATFSPEVRNTMLLRPNEEHTGYLDDLAPHSATLGETSSGHREVEGYRLLHMPTLARAYHAAVTAHKDFREGCDGVLVALSDYEVRWGVGVNEVFGCTQCDFVGELSPLYQEIEQPTKPGRNPADVDVGLQLALHSTSLSSAGARRFLSCLTVPSPSSSGLQKAANAFGPVMERENERDMAEKRNVVKDTLEVRGLARDSPIHAEFDRQYNNPLRNGRGRTPFAPATQSRDVVVENVTMDKYVVGFQHTNKLCSLGHAQRLRGLRVECPGHAGCSANLRAEQNIGDEESGGRSCAEELLSGESPLTVGFLTTDADGKAGKGLSSIMEGATNSTVENLLDQTHLNRSLRRALTSVKLTEGMFPAKTCRARQTQQKRFAEDMSYRVQAELNSCRRFHHHDCAKVEKSMADSVDCLLKCYSGDHADCHSKSFVCKRGDPYHFPYLPRRVKGCLSISGDDRQAIRRLLTSRGSRLSHKSLLSTRFETSTQKAEAVNSAFRTTNPKHSATFSRNARFRDHSAIHMINNGPGNSIARKMEAVGLKLSRNSRCSRTLKQIQKVRDYDKLRKRSAKYRTRRAKLRNRRYYLHGKHNNELPRSTYHRDQLLHDHSYPLHHSAATIDETERTDIAGTSAACPM